MNHDDMLKQQSRCHSPSSITVSTYMQDRDVLYHGKYPLDNRIRTTFDANSRKEKTNSIFSFLQRFRAKNKNVFEHVTSLPSSPRSTRFSGGRTCRWESVESILSSSTATSFAFIPSHQYRNNRKFKHTSYATIHPSNSRNSFTERDSSAYLRKKYNLLGSDGALSQNTEDFNQSRKLKKLNRNSLGNVENLKSDWLPQRFTSLRQSVKHHGSINCRPKSEYDNSDIFVKVSKLHCHKPGKRRAPQPPIEHLASSTSTVLVKRIPSRKKRKAPSPPKNVPTMDMTPEVEVTAEEGTTMCNDSLKLEKGVLKANKTSTVVAKTSVCAETTSIPVSPKPWYKRSATRSQPKSIKNADKKKTCEQLLDEWMLEAGLPRSSAFFEERKVALSSPQTDQSGKRKSQISMLANISELDREAAEIVQKERNRERDEANSINNRFYEQSLLETSRNSHYDTFASSVDESNSSKRHTSKDLLPILNAITNVTQITVNSSFFKESPEKTVTKETVNEELKSDRDNKTAQMERKSKLTITELEDFDNLNIAKERALKRKNVQNTTNEDVKTVVEKNAEEPVKPVKPFSSWMCPQCTLENPSWKFICEACNKWRPYSANKSSVRTTAVITPKEDLELKLDNLKNRKSLVEEREIDKISEHIRKQVYDMLTSNESMKKNISRLKTPVKDDQRNVERFVDDKSAIERSDQNIEEIRKARLAFFTKNCLNDLNINRDNIVSNFCSRTKPMNVRARAEVEHKNKYYNEEDRKKLREILKELKNSLPKHDNSNKLPLHAGGTKIEPNKNISNIAKVDDEETTMKNEQKEDEKVEAYCVATKSLFEYTTPKTEMKSTGNEEHRANGKIELKIPTNGRETRHTMMSTSAEDEIKKINVKMLPATKTEVLETNSKTSMQKKKDSETFDEGPSFSKQLFSYKNGITGVKENKNVTNMAVNRLLKKLQTAIASGQHHEAANIARELARLKVNCNVTRQDNPENAVLSSAELVPCTSLNIRIKDTSSRDLFSVNASAATTINELQTKISKAYNIPVHNQRLMFEKKAVTDDTITLDQMGINTSDSTIVLDVVSTENENPSPHASDQLLIEKSLVIEKSVAEKQTIPESVDDASRDNVFLDNGDITNLTDVKHTANGVEIENKVVELVSKETDTGNVDNLVIQNADIDNKSSIQQSPPEKKESSNVIKWECPRCTFINEHLVKNCFACGRRNDNKIIAENKSNLPKGLSNVKQEFPKQKLTNYQALMDLEKNDLITNVEQFECSICLATYHSGEGVILKDCLHTFCRECLSQTIEFSAEAEIKCPYRDADYSCESVLQEREIKALVSPQMFDKHLARSVSQAENKIQNAFHCKTVDCRGWCIFEDNVNEYHCPVCFKTNCLTCQVIHTGLNCKQYQEVINKESETNADANITRLMLQEMLQKGEAMTCPTCHVILMKKWGCDWLRCTMCKTEICWVTRGPRWGPQGKGDTSGGCRCGVNGVKCHQKCTFCH